MAKIGIDVYEGGTPAATITIPAWVVTGASKILPKIAGKELREHIDLDQLAELVNNPQASGVVLEVEDHKDNERVVISIVGEDAKAVQK
jgi:hypothetical protein